ncbi:MAG: hypothetical protein ACTSSP_04600 [Candidatus Asgardarchaeia archaeon]
MNKKWMLKIGRHEKKKYSQLGQDGVLDYIFNNISTKNSPPFCIEFGFNSSSLKGGSGSNVANLVKNKGWECLLLDGDYENPEINLYKHFLTEENICDIFKSYEVPKEFEYLSIDVDSIDLWLFRGVLSKYSPMVASVEYNAHFPIDRAITISNDTKLVVSELKGPQKRRMYGASLKALKMVGNQFGYTLVHVVKGTDLFFIRNDLIKGCESYSLESFGRKVHINWHSVQKNRELIDNYLDYEEYLRTDGDIEKSKKAAVDICEECILKKIPRR